jgi:hypothetical protein
MSIGEGFGQTGFVAASRLRSSGQLETQLLPILNIFVLHFGRTP